MTTPLDAPAPTANDTLADTELASTVATLMQTRQTILPKRLGGQGPDAQQLQMILEAAASAPDHGRLLPWRFVLVPQAARQRLADVFGAALLERDAAATPEQVEQAREKAHRAPLLLLVIVNAGHSEAGIDPAERIASVGCALQNMLLMTTALGYGSALTSGKALKSSGLRQLFGLSDDEQALCFLSIGTPQARKSARQRPAPGDYVSILGPSGAPVPGF
jgi:nitroreductase